MTRATQRSIALAAHLLLLAFVCIPAVNAQESQPEATPQATPLPAPPPFKMIVKEEREAIELQSRDSSKRLKLLIEFAGGHLTRAEQHTARENFEAASAEIGMYHALIESALAFLNTVKRDSN